MYLNGSITNGSQYLTVSQLYDVVNNNITPTEVDTKISTALQNYYTKTDTYSKTEVNNLISTISTGGFQVVSELPASGESNIIYLVSKSQTSEDNIYNEYIWVNNDWELIGTTQIDLTNYVTNDSLSSTLSNYVLTTSLNSTLENYSTTSEINQTLNNYVTSSALSSTLQNYVTSSELSEQLNNYSTTYEKLLAKPQTLIGSYSVGWNPAISYKIAEMVAATLKTTGSADVTGTDLSYELKFDFSAITQPGYYLLKYTLPGSNTTKGSTSYIFLYVDIQETSILVQNIACFSVLRSVTDNKEYYLDVFIVGSNSDNFSILVNPKVFAANAGYGGMKFPSNIAISCSSIGKMGTNTTENIDIELYSIEW